MIEVRARNQHRATYICARIDVAICRLLLSFILRKPILRVHLIGAAIHIHTTMKVLRSRLADRIHHHRTIRSFSGKVRRLNLYFFHHIGIDVLHRVAIVARIADVGAIRQHRHAIGRVAVCSIGTQRTGHVHLRWIIARVIHAA